MTPNGVLSEKSGFAVDACQLDKKYSMKINTIQTQPFADQKPGTSGLRKKVREFQVKHYLENYVQSIFDSLPEAQRQSLVIGGDGRYYNREAMQTIIAMALANGFNHLIIGCGGLLSTPAASHLIRRRKTSGGLILSASHNPGGVDGDFGLKFNTSNGGPAPETVTNRIFELSKQISSYRIADIPAIDLDVCGTQQIDGAVIEIVDSVADYAELMEHLFDFDLIKSMFDTGAFAMAFDAMHAVTGPYAREIIEHRLGAHADTVINAVPLPDFGGGHPDPSEPAGGKRYGDHSTGHHACHGQHRARGG